MIVLFAILGNADEWGEIESFEEGDRYYICSIGKDAEEFNRAARGHWGVEVGSVFIRDIETSIIILYFSVRRRNRPGGAEAFRRL